MKEANLELHDLLDAIARLAHSAHLLVERAHASADAFGRARRDGYLVRERERLCVELIDAGEEGLQAGEGGEDGPLVCEERGERGGELGFFGLEGGERGKDLRECRQRRWGRTLCGWCGWCFRGAIHLFLFVAMSSKPAETDALRGRVPCAVPSVLTHLLYE